MPHWNRKKAIRIICKTRQTNIPRRKRSQQSKHAACFLEFYIRPCRRGVQVGETEHEEGEPDHEEQEGEGYRGAERKDPEDEGEDEPALCWDELIVRIGGGVRMRTMRKKPNA